MVFESQDRQTREDAAFFYRSGSETIAEGVVFFPSSSFTVRIDDFEAIMTPPVYRLYHRGNEVSVDLELRNLGTPFWFNQGKEEGARISPSNLVWGMELFGKVEGSITLQGK